MIKFVILLVASLLALFSLTACSKDEAPPASADVLIFGSFYGECAGEGCIEIFRLDPTRQTLEEDTRDQYPSTTAPYTGTYVARNPASYQRTLPLRQQIPSQLLATSATVIGQPDAADQGGYYVEVNQAGIRRFWLIDTHKVAIPAYLHDFTDSLRVNIGRLR